MTGANFAVAETGAIVVCTNEGNADLSVNLPNLYIARSARKSHPRVGIRGVRPDAASALMDHAADIAFSCRAKARRCT
jgi:hypothetical protein